LHLEQLDQETAQVSLKSDNAVLQKSCLQRDR